MKASQKDLLEHSEQKVKLLQEYLSAYFSMIARDGHMEEIQITDVFCGEGMFPNGKVGSPLVFGRMAASLLAQNPAAPRIKFRFNDAEAAKASRVHDHLAPLEAKHDRLTLLAQSTEEPWNKRETRTAPSSRREWPLRRSRAQSHQRDRAGRAHPSGAGLIF